MKGRKSSLNSDAPPERIFIGVAGGSAAGKTTLCETINRQMAFDRNFKVETISLDSFYKSIDKTTVDVAEYNFDHPLALDFDLAYEVLNTLKYTNEPVAIPQYSFVEHQRLPDPAYINPANIIMFEGLMAFHDERIRNLLTYKIFINCDDDIRLCRRIKRDTTERGRTIVGVLKQYNKFVKNAFRDFIYPTVAYADLVIPGHRNNRISVDFIVQHIKNMAKKINILEKASRTRVFLVGETDYYDRNVSLDYKNSVVHTEESFLIFPTSDEHRRELEFFMNTLMSEAFTQDYFEEIYIYQFMKIVRALLRQLMELKSYKASDVELISYFEVREKLYRKSDKKIKIVFIPFILSHSSDNILSVLKDYVQPNHTIIIVNIFCEMRFPKEVYNCEIKGLIFLNLLLVTNKRRLLDVLTSNNINFNNSPNYSWLVANSDLIKKGLHFVATELCITYEPFSWKDYQNLFEEEPSKEQGSERGFLKEKGKMVKLYTFPIRDNHVWNEDGEGAIEQISVLQQDHENLCGFHALHNIIHYPNLESMRSKQTFIEEYHKISEFLVRDEKISWLRKPLFNPLEREEAIHLTRHDSFFEKETCTLFISQNYIISSHKEMERLSKRIEHLNNGLEEELFILMGIYNHFFVVRLSQEDGKKSIQYIDSINTPIEQIMKGEVTVPNPEPEDYSKIQNLKTALNVVRALFYGETPIQVILVRLRVDEVIGSYYKAAGSGEEGLKKWLQDEFPPAVVKNDLLKELEKVKEKDLGKEHMEKVRKWLSQPFVSEHVVKKEEGERVLKLLQG